VAGDVLKCAQGRGVKGENKAAFVARSIHDLPGRDAMAGLRIAVTGHRFLLDLERVRNGVDEALDYIRARFPSAKYTVLSSLAEGADRLVAEEALDRGMILVVPMPLAETDYVQDFPEQSSREKFHHLVCRADRVVQLPNQPTRAESYQAAAEYMLEICDVVLAVWDGLGGQGVGGTGCTVKRARQRGLPIAWVHAGNRKPETDIATSLGDEQGVVTLENF
jgi:hypothetical protein